MANLVIIIAGLAVFAAAAWYGWQRWFRNSEVNLLADAMTFAGLFAELLAFLDDPGITELMSAAGIKPMWLVIFGVVVRFARRFRDPEMAVSKPYEEPPQ